MYDTVERFADPRNLFLEEAKFLHAALDARRVFFRRLGADTECSVPGRDLGDEAGAAYVVHPSRRTPGGTCCKTNDFTCDGSPSIDSIVARNVNAVALPRSPNVMRDGSPLMMLTRSKLPVARWRSIHICALTRG